MIITPQVENAAVLSNTAVAGEFTLRSSPKAFAILSSGLYKNKIRAIIRELCCNAVDSHVAAGTADVPFELHLPSTLEPWFSVRDYGTGLDADEVTRVYTVYFESTKTNSNQYIGALGLGSKSPFSYTDNFTVTAIKNSVKRIYGAFINDAGIPCVAMMYEGATDEPSGVEVKFNVAKVEDYRVFRNETDTLAWFKSPYKLVNSDGYKVTPIEYSEQDIVPGVHLLSRRTVWGKSYAVMGNIAYPLWNIPGTARLDGLDGLLEHALVIDFEIGDIEFSASREELSFVPKTYDAIKRRLKLLSDSLLGKVEAGADAITNYWEQMNYLNNLPPLYNKAVASYIKDHQNPLYSRTNTYSATQPARINLTKIQAAVPSIEVHARKIQYNGVLKTVRAEVLTTGQPPELRITARYDTLVILNDGPNGCMSRAFAYAKAERQYQGYDVLFVNYNPKDRTLLRDDASRKAAFDAFLAAMHAPPHVIYASAIPGISDKGSRAAAPTDVVYRYTDTSGYGYSYGRDSWDRVKVDSITSAQKCYVLFDAYTPRTKTDTHYSLRERCRMLSRTSIKGLRHLEVYGVNKRMYSKIKDKADWLYLDDYIAKVLDGLSDEFITHVIKMQSHSELFSMMSFLGKDTELYKQLSKYDAKPDAAITSNITEYELVIQSERGRKISKELRETSDLICKRYPLLGKLMSSNGFNKDDYIAYVKLVDAATPTA